MKPVDISAIAQSLNGNKILITAKLSIKMLLQCRTRKKLEFARKEIEGTKTSEISTSDYMNCIPCAPKLRSPFIKINAHQILLKP